MPHPVPEPKQSNFWWYLIGRAQSESPLLARLLAYAWGKGAIIGVAAHQRRILLPGDFPSAHWQRFTRLCLMPFRAEIKELLGELDLDAPEGMPALPLTDPVLRQFQIAKAHARPGIPPPRRNRFTRAEDAWQAYYQRVACGELFCPPPVGKDGDWVIPDAPHSDSETLLLNAVYRSRRSFGRSQKG